MRSFGFAAASVVWLLAGCGLDPSLTCGADCGDAGADATSADAPAEGQTDAPVTADAPADAPKDAPIDVVVSSDGACSTSCPSGTTCSGAFCVVPQGTACGSAPAANGSGGSFDGKVCAGSGPTITTSARRR
jgi:hypothetical protein